MKNRSLLVRHPTHDPTESLMGYILRLAQVNGYDTPWSLLTFAGMRQCEARTAGIRVSKLAAVTNRTEDDIEPIVYSNHPNPRICCLLQHPIPTMYLRLTKPALCPFCVEKKGFIEAHWDLAFMTGCPVHRIGLLTECPKCQQPLSRFRRGLLECSCGGSFLEAKLAQLPTSDADLLDVIRRKVLRDPLQLNYGSRIPSVQMMKLDLYEMLHFIYALGRHGLRGAQTNDNFKRLEPIISSAANVLTNWPSHLFTLLGTIVGSDRTPTTGYARGPLSSVYTSLIKGKGTEVGKKGDFLRYALSDFAEMRWGFGPGKRILFGREGTERSARYIGLGELARRLRVHPATANHLVDRGEIPSDTIKIGKYERKIIDSEQINVAPVAEGTVYRVRVAARKIGIPARLLEQLKTEGYYKCNHLPRTLPGFHKRDVGEFIKKLTSLVTSEADNCFGRRITFARALCSIRFSFEMQLCFMSAILSRQLPVVGSSGKTVKGLLISEQEFRSFTDLQLGKLYGPTDSYKRASEILRCKPGSISGLVQRRRLETVKIGEYRRVSQESIVRFQKEYVPLSVIAADVSTSSRALMSCCEKNNISMLIIKSRRDRQAFVLREDAQRVLSYWVTRGRRVKP
jgi:hypothetical protein